MQAPPRLPKTYSDGEAATRRKRRRRAQDEASYEGPRKRRKSDNRLPQIYLRMYTLRATACARQIELDIHTETDSELAGDFFFRRLRDTRVALMACADIMDALVLKRRLEGRNFWWITRARDENVPNGFREHLSSDSLKVDFVNKTTFWEIIKAEKEAALGAGEDPPPDPPRNTNTRRQLEVDFRRRRYGTLPKPAETEEFSDLEDFTPDELQGFKASRREYSDLEDFTPDELANVEATARREYSDLEDFTEEELASLSNVAEPMRLKNVCQIFRDSKVPTSLLDDLPQQLENSFASIRLKVAADIRVLDPPTSAFDRQREQFRADKIVDNCCAQAPDRICLYLLTDDAYSGTLNFVFGVAHRARGCMVTLYRLQNDPDFVLKECVHELGHVFGLGHCSLPCVMTFSNSVREAHQKDVTFCSSCNASLAKYGE